MTTTARRLFAAALLAVGLLVTTLPARAEALPPLAFEPPVTQGMLLDELAFGERAASQWLLEVDAEAMSVWVWRVPGDPDPVDAYADNAWIARTTMGGTHRDLRETMLQNIEYYASFFDLELDPTWSHRAHAFAESLNGIVQTFVGFSLQDLDADTYLTIDIMTPYIDVLQLRLLEGTYVRVTRLLDH